MPPFKQLEVRYTAHPIEFRAAPTGSKSPGIVVGYAAVFNRLSVPLGGDVHSGFRERIKPGAFTRMDRPGASDVIATQDHCPTLILGRRSVKTLTLIQDATGLRTEIVLPDTRLGNDMAVLLGRGDISGMSFQFGDAVDEWPEERTDDGYPVRVLVEMDIFDVCLTANPAYPDSTAGVQFRTASEVIKGRSIKSVKGVLSRRQLQLNLLKQRY